MRAPVMPYVTRQVLAMLVAVFSRFLVWAGLSTLEPDNCAHPNYGIPIHVGRGQTMSGTWHNGYPPRSREPGICGVVQQISGVVDS